MKLTKLISVAAAITLMGSSALYGVPPTTPGEMPVKFDNSNNTWAGDEALDNFSADGSPTGHSNTAYGWQAGWNTDEDTASDNTFIGALSGGDNTSGDDNTFMGSEAGILNTEGSENTFVGSDAGKSTETGSQNTFVGSSAGANNEGNGNVYLGFKAGYNETGNNKLHISNSDIEFSLIYGEFDDKYLEVNGEFQVNGTIENNDTITSFWEGNNTVGDGATQLLVLDANNTATDKTSDVGFAMHNALDDFTWTFRTYDPSAGFIASKINTGGAEFEVGNTSTATTNAYKDVVVKMGGVTVFENGQLVIPATTALVEAQALQLKVQAEKIAMLEVKQVEMQAKDAEMIAMKAEISELKTMQQKVAMMESILTNLALNVSDTDKSKVSINLK